MATNKRILLHPVVNGVENKNINLCPKTTINQVEGLSSTLSGLETSIYNKQDTLISGTNIKTINNTSILGSGNISISGDVTGPSSSTNNGIVTFNGTTGKAIKNTSITIDSSSNIHGVDSISSNIVNAQNEINMGSQNEAKVWGEQDGLHLQATNSDGDIYLEQNTTSVAITPIVNAASNKGKFLHSNDSTGALEWSAVGGLPSGTTAGQAMIWNGSQWSLTSGYGYEESGGGGGTVFEWDGDTTGKTAYVVPIGDPGEEYNYTFYQVATTTPYIESEIETLVGGEMTSTYQETGSEPESTAFEVEDVFDLSESFSNTEHIYSAGDLLSLIAYDNAKFNNVSFPKGVYAYYSSDESYIEYISKLTKPGASNSSNETIVHQIDSKFIPSELPTKVNDRYLHTNASTGALEWSTVSGGQTYTAGSGIEITNNVISADLTYSDFNSITKVLTNLTATGDLDIEIGGTANVTLVANSGYGLPSSISVSGASYTYNNSTGAIVLSNTTGNVTITASGVQQLEAPTISISGSTLTIPDVTNATSYDLYVDGVYNSNIPKAVAFTVTVNLANSYGGTITFYDGTSTSGINLGTTSGTTSKTVQVSTGNLYITTSNDTMNNGSTFTGGVSMSSSGLSNYLLSVTADGTATMRFSRE